MLASKAMLRSLWAAAACAGSLLLPAAPALASGQDVIQDCLRNGRLTKTYTQKEYASALADMPTDVQEYSDCEAMIRRARTGLGTSPGTGTGKAPYSGYTPAEVAQAQKDVAQAQRSGGRPQHIRQTTTEGRTDDTTVTPGALSSRKVSAGVTDLPGSLLALIVLIVLAAAYGAAQLWSHRDRASGPGA